MNSIKFKNTKSSSTEFICGGISGFLYFSGEEVSIESPADPFFEIPTKAMNLKELKKDKVAYKEVITCIEKYIAMAMA